MVFIPTTDEEKRCQVFSAICGVPYVFIRITPTMQQKSIIDAPDAFRALLKEGAVLDYDKLGRGAKAHGKTLAAKLVSAGSLQDIECQFYRPETKSGDPRFWPKGFRAVAVPGTPVLLSVLSGNVVIVCLDGQDNALADLLRILVKQVSPAKPFVRATLPKSFDPAIDALIESLLPQVASTRCGEALLELMTKVIGIRGRGWIATHRDGDTGIGFTFETLMGIKANSAKTPDYKEIELKCRRSLHARAKRKPSKKKQTLFALIPEWGVAGDRSGLVANYGWRDESRDRNTLYMTISVVPNPQGWALRPSAKTGRIEVIKDGKIIVSYDYARLENALKQKHRQTLFITAHARGRKGKGGREEFLFDQATYCEGASFAGFLALVEEGSIGLDFAIHEKNGKVRDHGFLWRIQERDIPRLFSRTLQLL